MRLPYVGETTSGPMIYDKLRRQDPSSAFALVVETLIHIENPSELDDAVTQLELSIGRQDDRDAVQHGAAATGKVFGVNVPAHQMVSLDLQFTFSANEFGNVEGWNYSQRADGVAVAYRLELKSLRGKTFRFKLTPQPKDATPGGCAVAVTRL